MNPLKVTYLDGREFEVTPTPGDIVRFERHFGVAAAELGSSMRLEHMYFIAWAGLKRLGVEGDDFEAFLDTVGTSEAAPLAPTATE